MFNIKFLLLSLLILFSISGCEKEPIIVDCPKVLQLNIEEATAGTPITISGSGFVFHKASAYQVMIGNQAIPADKIMSVDTNSNQLVFEVPEGISSGVVSIQYNNGFEVLCARDSSNVVNFSYEPEVVGGLTLVAGSEQGSADGIGSLAKFSFPTDLVFFDEKLYFTDLSNHVIRKIDVNSTAVITYAGVANSPGHDDNINSGTQARFNKPAGITIDKNSNKMYVTERGNCMIREINLINSGVKRVTGKWGECTGITAGDNLPSLTARFRRPEGIAVQSSPGNTTILVSVFTDQRIRKIGIEEDRVSTFAGGNMTTNACLELRDGIGTNANFCEPDGITNGDYQSKNGIFVLDALKKAVRHIDENQNVETLEIINDGAELNNPKDIAYDGEANLYIADYGSRAIFRLNLTSKKLTVLIPSGQLEGPEGITYDQDSKRLFIADTDGHVIYSVQLK